MTCFMLRLWDLTSWCATWAHCKTNSESSRDTKTSRLPVVRFFLCKKVVNGRTSHLMGGRHRRLWTFATPEELAMHCRHFRALFTSIWKVPQVIAQRKQRMETIPQLASSRKTRTWCPQCLRMPGIKDVWMGSIPLVTKTIMAMSR